MNEHPILGQLVLGYCPLIDRQRVVLATRLSVFALRPMPAPTWPRCWRCCSSSGRRPTTSRCC